MNQLVPEEVFQLTYLTMVYVESGANNWSYVNGASKRQLLTDFELGHTDMSYYIASYQMNKWVYLGLWFQLISMQM
jgi:hypothetical protein